MMKSLVRERGAALMQYCNQLLLVAGQPLGLASALLSVMQSYSSSQVRPGKRVAPCTAVAAARDQTLQDLIAWSYCRYVCSLSEPSVISVSPPLNGRGCELGDCFIICSLTPRRWEGPTWICPSVHVVRVAVWQLWSYYICRSKMISWKLLGLQLSKKTRRGTSISRCSSLPFPHFLVEAFRSEVGLLE